MHRARDAKRRLHLGSAGDEAGAALLRGVPEPESALLATGKDRGHYQGGRGGKGIEPEKRQFTIETDCFNQNGDPVVKGEAVVLSTRSTDKSSESRRGTDGKA